METLKKIIEKFLSYIELIQQDFSIIYLILFLVITMLLYIIFLTLINDIKILNIKKQNKEYAYIYIKQNINVISEIFIILYNKQKRKKKIELLIFLLRFIFLINLVNEFFIKRSLMLLLPLIAICIIVYDKIFFPANNIYDILKNLLDMFLKGKHFLNKK